MLCFYPSVHFKYCKQAFAQCAEAPTPVGSELIGLLLFPKELSLPFTLSICVKSDNKYNRENICLSITGTMLLWVQSKCTWISTRIVPNHWCRKSVTRYFYTTPGSQDSTWTCTILSVLSCDSTGTVQSETCTGLFSEGSRFLIQLLHQIQTQSPDQLRSASDCSWLLRLKLMGVTNVCKGCGLYHMTHPGVMHTGGCSTPKLECCYGAQHPIISYITGCVLNS